MPARTIEIPSFEFSSFYYPEILEALILYKRQNVPELTDESDFEPLIQLLRAFAAVGHLNNVLLDLVANESTLPTAQLTETVRNMLRLIDYELSPATPATVDIVYELAAVFSVAREIVSEDARAATRPATGETAIPFEALTPVTVSRTDRLTACFAEDELGAFIDHTAAANSGAGFIPSLDAAGRKLYWIHDSVMWSLMDIVVSVAMANISGVFEFYDGDFGDLPPDSVTNIGGGQLQFDLTGLLGPNNRAGAVVRVRSNDTGAFEDVVSTWTGTANVATTGFLGQTTPSTSIDDYQVGTEWTELALAGLNFADGTTALSASGEVSYNVPQTTLWNWQKTQINSVTGFAIRWRTVTSTGGTNPTLGLQRIDTGKQYTIAQCTQGRTVEDNPLGSSNGTANQEFETTRDYFISQSEEVLVDGAPWVRVDNFLSSRPQDQHYRIVLGENDRATVVFGDGAQGRIPPVGAGNISIAYRVDANNDGNVGANTVVIDKTGLSFVNSLYNPRQASGWAEAEGASEESLEQAKVAGPASLRVKEVALTADDLIVLTQRFVASDGSSPFSRATYIEEGFGPKTVMLIVVGAGGVTVSQTLLDELNLYFNGDKFAAPPAAKHFVANQEATAVNFDTRAIDVTAVVAAPEGVAVEAIENQLAQVLQPEALKDDGVTFEWDFGGKVPTSRINHEIFNADDRIEDVDITVPAADVLLNPTELPVLGTLNITIVEP